MKNKYSWVSVIAASVLVLDQITKFLVVRYLPRQGIVQIIPGFFDITSVRNPGGAFGLLAGAQGWWRTAFFVSVSIVALAVIVAFVRKSNDRLSLVAFALISGGAVGNLVDRIRFGEVVDFIDWYFRSWHWPAFNIADAAITVGVALLAVELLFPRQAENRAGQGQN
jgi:signal peptidase II